jgi:lysophospholipase L1-like esterase
MAADLATRFGIEAPSYDWQWYDLLNGTALIQDSGAFSVCAKYGGRTDDLVQDNDQVVSCIPEDRRDETTLVVMTVGGNDLFSLVEDYHAGIAIEELWVQVENEVQLLRDAVTLLRTDKSTFPGEMFVVFANIFEFTDGMGNVDTCPGAASLGYVYDLSAPELVEMIRYYEEEYMRIAVDTQADMVFMGEGFCGHGYNADDPTGPCYREDDRELWFDLTCFHPNDLGHAGIAEMMLSTVDE